MVSSKQPLEGTEGAHEACFGSKTAAPDGQSAASMLRGVQSEFRVAGDTMHTRHASGLCLGMHWFTGARTTTSDGGGGGAETVRSTCQPARPPTTSNREHTPVNVGDPWVCARTAHSVSLRRHSCVPPLPPLSACLPAAAATPGPCSPCKIPTRLCLCAASRYCPRHPALTPACHRQEPAVWCQGQETQHTCNRPQEMSINTDHSEEPHTRQQTLEANPAHGV